jgi:cytochrome P450
LLLSRESVGRTGRVKKSGRYLVAAAASLVSLIPAAEASLPAPGLPSLRCRRLTIMKVLNSIAIAPGALPVLGHGIPLLRDPLGFLAALPRVGDLVRIRIGPATAVVVCDPELLGDVLHDDRTFDKGGPFFDRIREILGDGLATCPYERHRRQRRLLQPAFHAARLPGYARAMIATTIEVVDRWRDNQITDVLADLMTITSRTFAVAMFSGALSASALDQAVADIATLAAGTYRRMLTPPPLDRLPTPGNRRYRRARARLRGSMGDVIAQRRANAADRGDLLSAMLAGDDPDGDGPGLSDAEIIDNLMTFVLAGTESTSSTLAWALHLLAEHPDVERQVHAEVDAVLRGTPASFEHLPELRLTARGVTEALRLFPPGWMFTRTVTTETRIGGHLLPAGTSVLYSPYIVHHRSDLYDEPEHFDPDRWDSTRPRPPRGAYLPSAPAAAGASASGSPSSRRS